MKLDSLRLFLRYAFDRNVQNADKCTVTYSKIRCSGNSCINREYQLESTFLKVVSNVNFILALSLKERNSYDEAGN